MYYCNDAKMMVVTITDLPASIIGNSKEKKRKILPV